MEIRRLAAIVAVDIVGYSRLMNNDESRTAVAVRTQRETATPIVREWGGRIVKTMGDGMLLEFPSIVAAVECAVRFQRLMAEDGARASEDTRIVYRVGLHLGDVLVDGDDIIGDCVNVAARLEGACEPGGLCLSADAFRQVTGRVSLDFADLGDLALKNVGRPIRAYAVRPETILAAPLSPVKPTVPPIGAHVPPLSLVVLPLVNLGVDAGQDYFVDGVTESLTTDLSRIAGAFVIGRNTAFAYKGRSVDLRQVGRDLSVRYALEGSVLRAGARMRVNVQLIETETGAHLLAERFDKPIADILDMQDEIVSRLAGQLSAEMIAFEARRARQATHANALVAHVIAFAGVV
jgi:TolB-like protein/class 3 adenylate cyclase